ncbi:MAG: BPL-N domain-containing protein [Planctomycetota bacterium]|nr:BPL-N domain-containing protein [Planctomycetota bacterium]
MSKGFILAALVPWMVLSAAMAAPLAPPTASVPATPTDQAAAAPPARLPAGPAAQPHVLCQGTAFATPYYVIESGKAGPTVMIVGGMHGDEIAGAAAADEIRCWKIACGKLVVLPQANRPALQVHKRVTPAAQAPADESNLNRDFPSAADAPVKGKLAGAIWNLVEKTRPDWLIDLHEGAGVAAESKSTVGSSVIASRNEKAREEAGRMIQTVNETIPDEAKRFLLKSQPIEGSLARAAAERLKIPAMIAETTMKDQALSLRARQHRRMVYKLLGDLQMAVGGPDVLIGDGEGRIRAAVYDGDGAHPRSGIEAKLTAQDDVVVRWIGAAEIDANVLGQFDVLIMPGGGGHAEANGLGKEGVESIRRFVGGGGGYIGICAGAYLATTGYAWSLGIINARMVDYNRGKDTVKIQLSDEGRRLLGDRSGPLDVLYANGPVVGPAEKKDLPPLEVLATFLSAPSKCDHTPKAEMVGTPAIVAAPYQKGRVVIISPHPEATPGLEGFVRNAVRWVAKRDPKPLDAQPADAKPPAAATAGVTQ